MSDSGPCRLRIEFKTVTGSWYSAEYDTFRVMGESRNYRIHVEGYSGDLYDVMNIPQNVHNGMHFSTYDCDLDHNSGNCAAFWGGGWWYRDCFSFNPNGQYDIVFSVLNPNNTWLYLSASRMMIHWPGSSRGQIYNGSYITLGISLVYVWLNAPLWNFGIDYQSVDVGAIGP